MRKARRELSKYIRDSLDGGYSFNKIEGALVARGYSRRVAEGIILKYKYHGNVLKWLTVISLFVLFILSIFLSGTGIIGMVTIDYKRSFADSLSIVVNESSAYSWYPSLKGEIVSVAVTGNLLGEGDARIYVENNNGRYLIFDSKLKNFKVMDISSSLLGGKIKHFDIVCEESCILEGFNKSIYNLVFEVNNSVLEVEEIYYDIKTAKQVEAVPEFLGIPNQEVNINGRLLIDLNSFFNSTTKSIFSYLSEDDNIQISIDNGVAEITPLEEGNSYVYFIAKIGGIEFMSNLISINIISTGDREKIVRGTVVEEQVLASAESEKKSPSNGMTFILLFVSFLVIIILAVIPSRYYDMNNLAGKIDKLRRTKTLSNSLNEYNLMKKELKRKDLSVSERDKLIELMQEKIKGVARNVPKLKLMQEFNEKCEEFEEAKDKKSAERIYTELRKVYLKLIESKLAEKDKNILYAKMDGYYNKLRK